jgi:hypothetical protein
MHTQLQNFILSEIGQKCTEGIEQVLGRADVT